ncbi:MAG: hypothetical protein JXB14_02885, partial [Candidatus Altiarchaeota archaeon]|nr:hypothetical protein [Candidatus Altiarchaeota archaeon]
ENGHFNCMMHGCPTHGETFCYECMADLTCQAVFCDDPNPCTYDLCKNRACVNNNINLDGSPTIGLGDIMYVLAYWATTGPNGDIDMNGNVGLSDIITIVGMWANACP